NKNKIYHNAGVTQDMKDMFFKGDYINKDPFNEDFSHINRNKASYEYTKLITEAKDWIKKTIKKAHKFKGESKVMAAKKQVSIKLENAEGKEVEYKADKIMTRRTRDTKKTDYEMAQVKQ